MATPASSEKPGTLAIVNIGLMLSGDLGKPILDADTLLANDGKITAIGSRADCDVDSADRVVDAKGVTLCPGLIDSHVHPVAGDWTPRQSQLNWIDSSLHGGVTTMISAGEVHMPGRPKDIVGLKAMAIAAQRWFTNFRPNGVKVHAGAPIIEQGMEEQDFKDPDTGQIFDRSVLDSELSKIEKPAGIANPKDFRNEVVKFTLRARAQNDGRNPAWTSYEKLREVIEKRMFSHVEDLLPVIGFGSKRDKDSEEKHDEFVQRMVKRGYTEQQVRRLVSGTCASTKPDKR